MNDTVTPRVQVLAPGEGRSARIGTHELSYKARSTEGHGYSLIEMLVQPQKGAALHSHPREESMYVLSGEIDVLGDAGVVGRACAGAVIHVPAHALHGFTNAGTAPARVLSIGAAGQEDFFEDLAEAAAGGAAGAVDAAFEKHEVVFHQGPGR